MRRLLWLRLTLPVVFFAAVFTLVGRGDFDGVPVWIGARLSAFAVTSLPAVWIIFRPLNPLQPLVAGSS